MQGLNLLESFSEFKEVRNISREKLLLVLQEVFRSAIRKKYGSDENFDIVLNPEKGDIEMFQNLEVVEDEIFEDDVTEISLTDAQKIDPDYEVGDDHIEQIFITTFGRRNITFIKQNLFERIRELQDDEIRKNYENRIGELVYAEVFKTSRREILLKDADGNELVLPKEQQIPGDYFKQDDQVKAVVAKVESRQGGLRIVLSRTAPEFLKMLFEQEIPEILDGLITVKNIVRRPGERAKVAVESYDDRVDPVGACVGMKGNRIHGIVRELKNENIDVINYTTNDKLFIARALNPAKISEIELFPAVEGAGRPKATVYLAADQVSLAIGRGGQNIKLASDLTGYSIEVYRDDQDPDDVGLDEFSDEIDSWVLDALKEIGCFTAKDVMKMTVEDLEKRTDLEVETIQEIREIFEDELSSES